MANPGYPMGPMGQMPPMGGPQMPMAQHRPVRQGTSKAVPVVVSAGLAVGVFCGLLFGLGTGKHEASAAPAAGSGSETTAASAVGATAPTPVGSAGSAAGSAMAASAGSGSAAVGAAAGSGSAAVVAGSGAGSAAAGSAAGSAVPEVKIAKLIVNVKPPEAAAVAKISVDGAAITGTSLDIPTEKKTVDVVVKAAGYHSYEHAAPLVGGQTTTLDVELIKRAPEPPHPSGGHPPPHKPKGGGNGGLIDI